MRAKTHNTVQLGELVVAAFDNAAQYSTDPKVVSRLATDLIVHMLRRAEETSHVPRGLSSLEKGNS